MGVCRASPGFETEKKRKRVGKACDRCRLKKSKCDASIPCHRCKSDNAICLYGDRKSYHNKAFIRGYGEMLEQQQAQLVTGLQRLYKKIMNGEVWPGSPLKEVYHGNPLTHDILERLGVLEQENYRGSGQFQEMFNQIEQRLGANEGVRIQTTPSSAGGLLETDQSSVVKEIPHFNTPVASKQPPPTQSAHSAYSHPFRAVSSSRPQESIHSTSEQSVMNPTLLSPVLPMVYNQDMDFISRYASPIGVENTSGSMLQQQIVPTNISTCLLPIDWAEEEDFWDFNTALVPEGILID